MQLNVPLNIIHFYLGVRTIYHVDLRIEIIVHSRIQPNAASQFSGVILQLQLVFVVLTGFFEVMLFRRLYCIPVQGNLAMRYTLRQGTRLNCLLYWKTKIIHYGDVWYVGDSELYSLYFSIVVMELSQGLFP